MKRFALVLLAAGALVVALFLMAPWEDGAELIPADPRAEAGDAGEGPGAELAGEKVDKGAEFTSAAASTPDRKTLGTAKIRVAGRLVGERGVVLGDRTVHLYLGKAKRTNFWPGAQSTVVEAAPAGVARTDATGAFALQAPLGKGGRIALAGGNLVWVKRPPRFLGSEQDLDLGELRVQKGATLSGLVLSDTDAPIDAAKLQFANYENFQIGPRMTKSDSAGKFKLEGLPGGQAYLTISREGHMTRYMPIELERGKARENMVVHLTRGEKLVGTVCDDQSKPIEGASVRVSGQGRRLEGGVYEYDNGSAKTDKNGEFRVTGLGQGPFRVNASAKGHMPQHKNKIGLRDGPVRVELARLGILVGRLVDERGDPLVGSRVYATPKDPHGKPGSRSPSQVVEDLMIAEASYDNAMVNYRGRRSGVKTDANGKFTLENIKPGTMWLVATGSHRRAIHGPLVISAGEQADECTISAVRGAVAVVRVVDPDGHPVEKVKVTLRGQKAKKSSPGMAFAVDGLMGNLPMIVNSPGRATNSRSGETNQAGVCELAGLQPGKYDITVTHKSWVSPKPVPLAMPDKGHVETEIALDAGGMVSVRVFDFAGKPAAEQSFRILVASAGSGDAGGPKKKKSARQVSIGRTDVTGRATVGPIAAGEYEATLQLTSADSGGMMGVWGNYYGGGQIGREIGERVAFKVTAEQTVEVKLTRPELATVVGNVTDGSGPVRNGVVMLAPHFDKKRGVTYSMIGAGLKRTRTDAAGAFEVEGLLPGKYTLTIQRKKGQMSFSHEIVISGSGAHREDLFLVAGEVKIELLSAGKPVEDQIVTLSWKTSGNPNVGMMWQMNRGRSRPATATSDAKGIAHFEIVPPGTYSIRLKGKRFMQPAAGESVTVEGGGTANKKLGLVAAASLVCSCDPASGSAKVRMFQIELTFEGSAKKPKTQWMHGPTGTRGGLQPGRYSVRARRRAMRIPGVANRPAEWSAPATVELLAGKVGKVKIVLP